MKPKIVAQLVKNIDPHISILDREGKLLYKLARENRTGAIVEIGSWKGRSTIWLACGSRGEKVYAVDPHQSTDTHSVEKEANTFRAFCNNIKGAKVEHKVVPLVMSSLEAARKLGKEKVEVGLVFIDGSHELEAVRQDFNTWSSLLRVGGILALHDTIGYKGPREVAKSLLLNPYYNYLGVEGQIVYARKILPKNKKKVLNLILYLYWKTHSLLFLLATRLPKPIKEILK